MNGKLIGLAAASCEARTLVAISIVFPLREQAACKTYCDGWENETQGLEVKAI
jgi:hypothetical protein